jgi:hypothetical protein
MLKRGMAISSLFIYLTDGSTKFGDAAQNTIPQLAGRESNHRRFVKNPQ